MNRPDRLLKAGALVLDTEALLLTGPSGTISIARGTYVFLSGLLRNAPAPLSIMRVTAMIWPGEDPTPEQAIFGVRVRVSRARRLMERVGLDPRLIRSVRGLGYRIDDGARVVRPGLRKVADTQSAEAMLR